VYAAVCLQLQDSRGVLIQLSAPNDSTAKKTLGRLCHICLQLKDSWDVDQAANLHLFFVCLQLQDSQDVDQAANAHLCFICLQLQDSRDVDQAANLVAFDRANHMGISDKSAAAIR
jgi:hypothetical protein